MTLMGASRGSHSATLVPLATAGPGVVLLGQVATRLPMVEVACNRCPGEDGCAMRGLSRNTAQTGQGLSCYGLFPRAAREGRREPSVSLNKIAGPVTRVISPPPVRR
jgi:hypothetical protein